MEFHSHARHFQSDMMGEQDGSPDQQVAFQLIDNALYQRKINFEQGQG